METFSALLAIYAGNSPVTTVTRSFVGLCLSKRLSKQSWGWWFETPSHPLWRHCNYSVSLDLNWSFLKILMAHLIKILPRSWQGSVHSAWSIQRLLMVWRWKKREYSQPWYWPSYPGIFWFLHQKHSLPEAWWRMSVSESGHQWCRLWFVVSSAPKHYYLNHWWLIVNWTFRKKTSARTWKPQAQKFSLPKCIWKYPLQNIGHFV